MWSADADHRFAPQALFHTVVVGYPLMAGMSGYPYILGTVAFTVYGQLVLKWRVDVQGAMPTVWSGKASFAAHLLTDPWVLSGLGAAFLAFLCWMGALSTFDLTYAYPFTSLSFILVLVLGGVLFKEPLSVGKVAGIFLICSGLVVGSRWS